MNLIEIGRIHTPFKQATGTPIQPVRAKGTSGFIQINPEWQDGLKDLEGYERIWVLFWCHRAAEPKMRVIPYRDTVERGLFATRAPSRPNPIAFSNVKLDRVEGLTLHVSEIDILDGTPLIDIKPYVPHYDNYPVTRCGWTDEVPDRHVVADARFEKKMP